MMSTYDCGKLRGHIRQPRRLTAPALCLCLLGLSGHTADAAPQSTQKVISQYALTSANDFPQRDPRDWRLLGSNDEGATWTELDERQGEVFQERHEQRWFPVESPRPFERYRLQIDRVRDPSAVRMVQLAEIELRGSDSEDQSPQPAFTDVLSAEGDNPPAETVGNLFDGKVETKWLHWTPHESTRGSWIQWQYQVPAGAVVTNIHQLQALRARAGDGYRIEIEAVVLGQSAKEDRVFLVDRTGCIGLAGLERPTRAGIGQPIRLTGESRWIDPHVDIRKGRVKVLEPPAPTLPTQISLEQPLLPGEDLQWVEIQGAIHYQSSTAGEISFDVQGEQSGMRVQLHSPLDIPPLRGTRVAVQGICRGAFNEHGEWVVAGLWAVGGSSLRLLDPQDGEPQATQARAEQTQQASATSTTATPIEQIRRLSQEEFESSKPVRFRGVVTDLLQGFVQDETAGIEITFPRGQERELAALGDYIEVEGSTRLGPAGTPLVSADRVVVLGPGKLPAPHQVSLNELIQGRTEAQWIEITGVVRATDGSHLLIISSGGELMATLTEAPAARVNDLVNAEVRVRGVGVTAMDDQGRIQGVHLLIPSLEHVDVLTPPQDPDGLPVRPIGSLLGIGGPRESFHRVKVEGVVTFQDEEKLFLEDASGSAMAIFREQVQLDATTGRSRWLYWRTPLSRTASRATQPYDAGQRVQVVGFPETHRYSPVLTEVIVTRLGDPEVLRPAEITIKGIEEGALDSRLVTFDGVLRGRNTAGDDLVLALEWKNRTLQVVLSGTNNDWPNTALGSRLRITGVCQVDPSPYATLGLRVAATRVLTRSPNDVVVLARPSWWTIQRALILVVGMAFVILAALLWIKALRRQVGERTAQLTAQIQLREETERRRAVEEERTRIAKDLHDDLGANLTRIVYLSQRVTTARREKQDTAQWFDLIPATARRTIQSLDEIVWAVDPRHDSLESLANYLSQFAQEHLTLAQVRCALNVPLVLPAVPLTADIRHNLLMATREALQNVVTHASAREARLDLKLEDDGLHISVTDNGSGFDPNSVAPRGNGLNNMRRRLQSIGGQLDIRSQAGQGTTVAMFIPQAALHGRVIDETNISRQQ